MEVKELSKLCDQWWKLRAARLQADHKAAELKAQESEAKRRIIEVMQESGVHTVGGKLVSVEFKEKQRVSPVNWEKLYEYIRKKKAWDVLQRRVNDSAVLARMADGEQVPGTEVIPVYDISYHQLKK